MPDEMKKILLVDDHPMIIEGLCAMLAGTPDLKVIGMCASPESAYTFLLNQSPDLVIMDISMKESNGLMATRKITASHPQIPVLIFTCNDERIYASMANSVGAKGLVMKDQPEEEILRAIRTVLQGQSYQSPRLAKTQNRSPAHPEELCVPLHLLSKKEVEVLDYLSQGYTTARIAQTLDVSLKTIETHRLKIRKKTGFDTQGLLVRWAICRRSKGLDITA